MQLIDASNAAEYLRASGRIDGQQQVFVSMLAGGVSNIVLLVSDIEGRPLFVLKQAREQLRVPDPWFCSVERIWREVQVLRVCDDALRRQAGDANRHALEVTVPQVLFEDRENYLFAMTAAPPHEVWKQMLMSGRCDLDIAAACGRMLGELHGQTWQKADVAQGLRDQSFFEALRIDPYYRHVARHSPPLAPALERLIESLRTHPRCLVHGDFSPKNLLVYDGGLMLVDCEVGHFGDPAFDLGFFLSHLVLKAFYSRQDWWRYVRLTFAFWKEYERRIVTVAGQEEYADLVERGIANFSGCLLARVAGKSRVDYLDEATQRIVRSCAEMLVERRYQSWPELIAALLPYLWQCGP